MEMDRNTGDICVQNNNGSAIVFDSFSPEGVVAQRNPIINSISKIHDQSRRFLADFNVNVKGTVSAVLSKSTVESYCVSDRRAALLCDAAEDAAPVRKLEPTRSMLYGATERNKTAPLQPMHALEPMPVCSTPFDMEIERRKRQCVRLFGDLISKIPDTAPSPNTSESWSPASSVSPSPVPSKDIGTKADGNKPATFASALLSRKPNPLPSSFSPFDHVYSRFTSPASSVQATPTSSYETIALCTVHKRDLLTLPNLQQRDNNEELAISTLSDLLRLKH